MFTSPAGVVDSLATLKIAGEAEAFVSTLKSLVVEVDGSDLLSYTWVPGAASKSVWSKDWTPTGDGAHVLTATVTNQDGATQRRFVLVHR